MSATHKTASEYPHHEIGSVAHVTFRVRCETLGHGEEVFLVVEGDSAVKKVRPTRRAVLRGASRPGRKRGPAPGLSTGGWDLRIFFPVFACGGRCVGLFDLFVDLAIFGLSLDLIVADTKIEGL